MSDRESQETSLSSPSSSPPSSRPVIEIREEVASRFDGMRLDRFLTERYRLSRSRAKKIIHQTLTLNGTKPKKAGHLVRAGDSILIRRPAPKEPDVERRFDVLIEGEGFLAIDKPAGLPVHPSGSFLKNTLTSVLKERYGTCPPPVLAHRLDRETSGVILVCRDKKAEKRLKLAFERGEVEKTYRAIVHGRVERAGTVDLPLGSDDESVIRIKMGVRKDGAPSVTRYRPLETYRRFTLLELQLETGRQHQIRAHMEAIGHPVVGDKIYGTDPKNFLQFIEEGMSEALLKRLLLARHALHACSCTFPHPRTGEPVTATAPFPEDMARFLRDQTLQQE
jgi:23S rRNA pseudouridine1911/1915/1917 synthase